jgi:hypothetical protein
MIRPRFADFPMDSGSRPTLMKERWGRTLVSLKVSPKIDPSAADRGTLGQVRPWESWNRRAWIKADLKFEQSQEPAASQVALRKVEFGRRTWRGRWAIRKFMWE